MSEQYVIAGLVRKRAELAGKIERTLEMLTTRALDPRDQRLLRLMVKRVGVALRHQRNNGRVQSDQGPGQYMVWEVVR